MRYIEIIETVARSGIDEPVKPLNIAQTKKLNNKKSTIQQAISSTEKDASDKISNLKSKLFTVNSTRKNT